VLITGHGHRAHLLTGAVDQLAHVHRGAGQAGRAEGAGGGGRPAVPAAGAPDHQPGAAGHQRGDHQPGRRHRQGQPAPARPVHAEPGQHPRLEARRRFELAGGQQHPVGAERELVEQAAAAQAVRGVVQQVGPAGFGHEAEGQFGGVLVELGARR
jgi:hypothetical protein